MEKKSIGEEVNFIQNELEKFSYKGDWTVCIGKVKGSAFDSVFENIHEKRHISHYLETSNKLEQIFDILIKNNYTKYFMDNTFLKLVSQDQNERYLIFISNTITN